MNKEDDSIDRKIMMAGNSEFKSYFYLENGVIVKEQHVKIENGIDPGSRRLPAFILVLVTE